MRILWLLIKAKLKSDSPVSMAGHCCHRSIRTVKPIRVIPFGYHQFYLCYECISSHTIRMRESTLLKLCCKNKENRCTVEPLLSRPLLSRHLTAQINYVVCSLLAVMKFWLDKTCWVACL